MTKANHPPRKRQRLTPRRSTYCGIRQIISYRLAIPIIAVAEAVAERKLEGQANG